MKNGNKYPTRRPARCEGVSSHDVSKDNKAATSLDWAPAEKAGRRLLGTRLRVEAPHKAEEQFSWGSRICPGNKQGVAGLERSQTWVSGRWCPELSDASLIQASIQVPLAFPDGLGVE